MNLDISASGLLSGFIFGVIGFWLFRQGRKFTDFRILFTGVALMVYPYFTHGPLADWGVGFGLCGLAYYFYKD